MMLKKEIEKLSEKLKDEIPQEDLTILKEEVQKLVESDLAAKALKVGEKIPSFTLPNGQGAQIAVQDLLAKGLIVIKFYRGGWCPYCNLELAALQAVLPEIKASGASLIAITPETPDNSVTTAEKNDLSFEILSDQGNAVAKQFGLEFVIPEKLRPIYEAFGLDIPAFNGDASFTLPLPATYVVGIDGKVIYQFADADYSRRAEPNDLLKALHAG